MHRPSPRSIHDFTLSNGGRAVQVLDDDVAVQCNFFGLRGDGSPAAGIATTSPSPRSRVS